MSKCCQSLALCWFVFKLLCSIWISLDKVGLIFFLQFLTAIHLSPLEFLPKISLPLDPSPESGKLSRFALVPRPLALPSHFPALEAARQTETTSKFQCPSFPQETKLHLISFLGNVFGRDNNDTTNCWSSLVQVVNSSSYLCRTLHWCSEPRTPPPLPYNLGLHITPLLHIAYPPIKSSLQTVGWGNSSNQDFVNIGYSASFRQGYW